MHFYDIALGVLDVWRQNDGHFVVTLKLRESYPAMMPNSVIITAGGWKIAMATIMKKNHVNMLTRANSRQLQRYGTVVPPLMLRASKIDFAAVKINGKTVQSAEVYAPYPPTELFEHLKVHCGWIELVDDNTVYSNGNKA